MNLTFGEQVKIVLSRKGMTIKELAVHIEERTGKKMSRQNLTQRLGRDNFQEQDMRMIASILGCPFYLTILEDEIPAENNASAAMTASNIEMNDNKTMEKVEVHEVASKQHVEEKPAEPKRSKSRNTKASKKAEKIVQLPEETFVQQELVFDMPFYTEPEETVTSEEIATPEEEVLVPEPEETTTPEEIAIPEPEETAAPEEEVLVPEETATPEEEVLVPESEETATPEEIITPEPEEAEISTYETPEYDDSITLEEVLEAEAPVEEILQEMQAIEEENLEREQEKEKKEEHKEGGFRGWRAYLQRRKKKEEVLSEASMQTYKEPVCETPIQEEPVYEAPVQDEPVYEEPMQEESVYEEPVYEEPAYEEPIGEINPYTNREYETNSVRVHPKRIGYVQVYDRGEHKWNEMTEWAFLGYQEQKKALLGDDYEEPIYLD